MYCLESMAEKIAYNQQDLFLKSKHNHELHPLKTKRKYYEAMHRHKRLA